MKSLSGASSSEAASTHKRSHAAQPEMLMGSRLRSRHAEKTSAEVPKSEPNKQTPVHNLGDFDLLWNEYNVKTMGKTSSALPDAANFRK